MVPINNQSSIDIKYALRIIVYKYTIIHWTSGPGPGPNGSINTSSGSGNTMDPTQA